MAKIVDSSMDGELTIKVKAALTVDEDTFDTSNVAAQALAAAKARLGIHSPSREFYAVGDFAVQGLTNALNDGQKSAQSAGSNVATASLAGLQNSLNMISALMSSGIDTSPTITPVIDDSQVRAGIQRVNTMMTNLTVGQNMAMAGASFGINQNGDNSDIVSAINGLRKDILDRPQNVYTVNGVTYDDGSTTANAVKTLVRAVKMNKATDWSPAPEDYYTKTETDASIQVLSDKISQQVSTTDKLGTRLSKVEQDSSSWSVTLETANAAKSAADNASQTASSAKSAADKANENASSAVSTAQNTVKSTTEQFYKSTSPTSLSGGSWSNSQPTWENGKYIWKRTYVVKNNGTTEYQPSANGVCITGATGATGPQGSTGKGLKSAVDQYYLSTSNTTQSGGSWSNTQPSWVSGKYIWTRTYQTWNDNTTTTTTPVLADALNKANNTASSALSTSSEAMGTATQAKSIANNANSTASSAKSAADKANTAASHAQSTADTARKEASNAAKTATNYMKFDISGLTVGDLTKNTLRRNVNIDNSSVNIRNGSNVLASFAESLIEIGKNTNTATISFLNGIVKLIGQKQTIEGTTFHDAHLLSTDMMTIGTGSTDPSSDKVNALISLNGMSGEREVLASVTDTQGHSTLTVRDSSASLYSDGDAGYSSVNVITNKSTSQVEIRTNGSNGNRALINYSHAIQYYNNSTLLAAYNGQTPCLWDGGALMFASQSATLSAPISEQPHGIIVIFALFDPTTNSLTNVMTNPFFVPKTAIDYDYVFTMFWENAWRMCTKRVRIRNTCIIGNDQNSSADFTATTGVKSCPRYFVLRRVYGV